MIVKELSMDPIIELGVTPKRLADHLFDKYYPTVSVIIIDVFEEEVLAYHRVKEKVEQIAWRLRDGLEEVLEELEKELEKIDVWKIVRLYSEKLEDVEIYLLFHKDP